MAEQKAEEPKQRILVPLVLGEVGKKMVKIADAWAQRIEAKVYFMHAINLSDRFVGVENVFQTNNEEILNAVQKKLDAFIAELDVKAPFENIVTHGGKPCVQITEMEEKIKATRILIGGRDDTVKGKKILGKNTDFVLHHAKCPVYVYKDHIRSRANKIIVPLGNISQYRLSEFDKRIIPMADEWALRSGAEIYFIHITRVNSAFYLPDIEQMFEPQMGVDSATENLGKKLEELIQSLNVKSPYQCIIRTGKPYYKIVDQQEALNARLILMSAHEHTTLGRLLMGSTTDHVMTNTPCSIFVYKEQKTGG